MNDHDRGVDESIERLTDNKATIAVAWALVGVPLLYGVIETLSRVTNLFTG